MFREHTVVRATMNLSNKILAGCEGTIVFVYTNPRPAYEVEFIDEFGNTAELLTVEPEAIEIKMN